MSSLLYILIGLIVLILAVFILRKFIPRKLNPIVSLLLWVVIGFLAYQLYSSIIGPVRFNKEKEVRYVKVIKKLKDIQGGELAYQELNRKFTGDIDSLVRFIDTAKFAITTRRDSVYADVAKNRAYGLSEGYYLETVVVDTIGYKSVKDSLYQGTDRYKTMINLPDSDQKFDLKAGTLLKNDTEYAVFEAKVDKAVVLEGLDKDQILIEKQSFSVEGVKGAFIKVGSMDDIDTTGNWSKVYDTFAGEQ